jgi:thioredoxin 1
MKPPAFNRFRRSGMATSQAVREISDQDFEELVNSGQPVFVDFWAPWCGPCRIIGPLVEELAPSYDGKVVITKMNVDENQGVPQKFGVTSIPTLMIFKNGKLIDRVIGAMPKPALQQFIDRNI